MGRAEGAFAPAVPMLEGAVETMSSLLEDLERAQDVLAKAKEGQEKAAERLIQEIAPKLAGVMTPAEIHNIARRLWFKQNRGKR